MPRSKSTSKEAKHTANNSAELKGRALADTMREYAKTTLNTKAAALRFLMDAGIVDESGKLAKQFR